MRKQNIKKVFAVLLAFVLVFAMTACSKKDAAGGAAGGSDVGSGSIEGKAAGDVVQEAVKNLNEVKSFTYDTNMDISIGIMGQDMDMKTTSSGEAVNKPLAAHMISEMDSGIMGTTTTESYVQEENGKYVVYTGMDFGDGEVMWFSDEQEIDPEMVSQYDIQSSMNVYAQSADTFKEAGTETINGQEATRFDGELKGSAIKDAIVGSGMGEEFGLGEDMNVADLFSENDVLPISIWVVNDTTMPIQYEMDMTAILKTVMDKMMEVAQEEIDAAAEGEEVDLSIDISKALVTMTFTGFNNVDSITVPADVIDAAEELDLNNYIDLDDSDFEGEAFLEEEGAEEDEAA